jgi:DNA uptake protein ComE-like DNA-binding protein
MSRFRINAAVFGRNHFSKTALFSVVLVATMTLIFAGCDGPRPSDQQVQQQAAQTTAAVKQGAEQAASATKAAAGVAVQDVNDVAAGVKEGIHESAPPVDLNSSSQVRLATLPGISFDKAGQIVDGRPYTSPRQLVSRGLLTRDQYAKIASQVTVGK